MLVFEGVYPPIPTPFEAGELSLAALGANLDKWLETGLHGFVVAGSNGESAYLTIQERIALISAVRARAGSRRVIAGTGLETTAATIELTKASADAGANAALVLPPHFFVGQMTPDVLRRHFEAVAEASPIPILLYNMPRNTGINLPAELVATLALHPNIVGIKDSGGDIVQITEIVSRTGPDFEVFAGSGSILFPALAVGARGGMMAVANVLPDACCALYALAREGRYDEARRVQHALLQANAAVTIRFGVPGLKAAMDALGYFGGNPRPPLLPLPASQRAVVVDIVRAAEEQIDQILGPR